MVKKKKTMMMITFPYIFAAATSILFATELLGGVECVIGINWGISSAQPLVPSTVVDLMMQNGVEEVRIYNTDEDILKAFCGSGIKLSVSIMKTSIINCSQDAEDWVQQNEYYIRNANIRRIYFGNAAFWYGLKDRGSLLLVLQSFQYLQDALNKAELGEQVKVLMSSTTTIMNLDNVTRPSDAEFLDPIKEDLRTYLRMIKESGAPFAVECFPIYYLVQKKLDDLSFGFNDNKSTYVVPDINGALYTNVFDVAVDSFVWSLKKIGADPDLEIVVSQVGWPTDGYPGATVPSAERFYKYLLPYVASNKGTPMRPGKPIDILVHALADENMNDPWFAFSRHWGIYRSNGEPKYKIDLTGRGRDIYPVRATGIMLMPERWCVFNGDTANRTSVLDEFEAACLVGDCTSLVLGGSCSNLTFEQNMSYAFNMYFQAMFQKENGCKFNGYGRVVTKDPSLPSCVFPVEPVKGVLPHLSSDGFPTTRMPEFAAVFVILLSFFWVLN